MTVSKTGDRLKDSPGNSWYLWNVLLDNQRDTYPSIPHIPTICLLRWMLKAWNKMKLRLGPSFSDVLIWVVLVWPLLTIYPVLLLLLSC